jgi:hypothetical protein
MVSQLAQHWVIFVFLAAAMSLAFYILIRSVWVRNIHIRWGQDVCVVLNYQLARKGMKYTPSWYEYLTQKVLLSPDEMMYGHFLCWTPTELVRDKSTYLSIKEESKRVCNEMVELLIDKELPKFAEEDSTSNMRREK